MIRIDDFFFSAALRFIADNYRGSQGLLLFFKTSDCNTAAKQLQEERISAAAYHNNAPDKTSNLTK